MYIFILPCELLSILITQTWNFLTLHFSSLCFYMTDVIFYKRSVFLYFYAKQGGMSCPVPALLSHYRLTAHIDHVRWKAEDSKSSSFNKVAGWPISNDKSLIQLISAGQTTYPKFCFQQILPHQVSFPVLTSSIRYYVYRYRYLRRFALITLVIHCSWLPQGVLWSLICSPYRYLGSRHTVWSCNLRN